MALFNSYEEPHHQKDPDKTEAYTNALIHASSPYLLQHAHNPVNWYPWDENVLQKARQENKLLIISIGYSACHWCHVMEHESYSDEEVAHFMNAHFISVKVDREERPDVDQIYMNASLLLTGGGGWPLNVFALPDGRPFYALTYLPKEQWMGVLNQVFQIYITHPEKVETQANALTEGIRVQNLVKEPADYTKEELKKEYTGLWDAIRKSLDLKEGGLGKAPKFPMPSVWEFLLQYACLVKHADALQAVTATLDCMARGGIYDQLGGGFARYSVDTHWHAPHFEKMLYDNGQLVSLYAHAFQLTKKGLYKEVLIQTLDFIEREMMQPDGGFYSSLNADSEGKEGKFYTWTAAEIKALLEEKEAALFLSYYQVTDKGNWEAGENILHAVPSDKEFAREHQLRAEDFQKILAGAKRKLFAARSQRVPPSIDDKVLTSWNALMIKGYVDAYKALGTEAYLQTALRSAGFMVKYMIQPDHGLWRSYKEGKVAIAGLLDDYAYLAAAFISLYQVTFDIHWLQQARHLTDYANRHFRDPETDLFFYTSDRSDALVARKKEIEDNVTPASNSVMAQVLYCLGNYFDQETYRMQAEKMASYISAQVSSSVPYFSQWAQLMGWMQSEIVEVAITGGKALPFSRFMQQQFLPVTLFLGGEGENLPLLQNKLKDGKTLIYICKGKVCQSPLASPEKALEQIKQDAFL